MFDDESRDEWQRPQYVTDLLQIKEGMTVADIGAGTGYFLPYLDQAVGSNGQVLAIDIEPNLIDYMNRRIEKEKLSNTRAELTKADHPGIQNQSTDKVIIVDTWHHISNRRPYVKKLLAGLKPGGEVYIVDFQPGRNGPGPSDKHRLPAKRVFNELEVGGFVTTMVYEELPYQYIVRGKKPE